MAALSAVVFTLSWWLGLYLLARDPRKPVLVEQRHVVKTVCLLESVGHERADMTDP